MVVTVQQIQNGLINYIEQEIAQKAVGLKKFMVYMLIPQLTNKVPTLLQQYHQNPIFMDFFDENGNVHLDSLYQTAKIAITKSGQIEYAGIIFNETDIDKLYSYIKNTVQGG